MTTFRSLLSTIRTTRTIPNLQRSSPQHSRPLILCHIWRSRPLIILYPLLLQTQHSVLLRLLSAAFSIHLHHRLGCCGRAVGHLRVWILGAVGPWRWGRGGCWEIWVFWILGFEFRFFIVESGLVGFVAVGGGNFSGEVRWGEEGWTNPLSPPSSPP